MRVVPKGLQTPLPVIWSARHLWGPPGNAVWCKECWKNCHVPVVCLLHSWSWVLSTVALTEGSFICLSRMWWLCRGHGAAGDQTPRLQGVMADGKVQVRTQQLQQFGLLSQQQKYKRVEGFLSRTRQLFSRSAGDTLKSMLEIAMLLSACAGVGRCVWGSGTRPCSSLRGPGRDPAQQGRASAGSSLVQSCFAEDRESCWC